MHPIYFLAQGTASISPATRIDVRRGPGERPSGGSLDIPQTPASGTASHWPAAALQFTLRHPAVTVAVVGARTAEEVTADVSCLSHPGRAVG